MNPELLSRLQFAFTTSFHFIYPPISMGLGLLLVVIGVIYVRTKDPKWRQLSFFWVKVYGLVFAMGVATGLVQEFEFGTNWADYSRFVGNIFGSLLAAEGIFAFFLEGGFLGLMLFGGNRLGPRMWLLSSFIVVFGAHFSALWIIMANSWMQTPAGYELAQTSIGTLAFMTSFKEVVFTPSFIPRILHTWVASWMVGASFVLSVSAFYVLKGRFVELGKAAFKVALPIFVLFSILQVPVFGAMQAVEVADYQQPKLAAMEGLWDTQSCAPMYIVGWVNTAAQTTTGISIPCLLSFLAYGSIDATVQGLNAFPSDTWAPINLTFQVYHLDDQPGRPVHSDRVARRAVRRLEAAHLADTLAAVDLCLQHLPHRAGDPLRLVDGGVRPAAVDRLESAAHGRRRLAEPERRAGIRVRLDVRGALRAPVRPVHLPAE